ncbi:hypothetical protein ACO0RG_003207 [Hanseniaspora osmophila]
MSDLAAQLGLDPSMKKKKTKKTVSIDAFDAAVGETPAASTDDAMFAGLKKKKKKAVPAGFGAEASSGSKKEGSTGSGVSSEGSESKSVSVDDLSSVLGDMTLKKKKKKKQTAQLDDFEQQLAKAGVDTSKVDNGAAATDANGQIIDSDSVTQKDVGLPYAQLLSRFFDILRENNPELAGERSGAKFRIPPPVVQRDGKKSIFVNIQDISEKLQRNPEHLIQYLFAELGTSGSVDGQKRLVIKGKFQSKQMEGVLRRYIIEYVTCKTCKSINTELRKEQSNRLFFLVCKSCGSTRSVSSIKSGFQATVKRIRK